MKTCKTFCNIFAGDFNAHSSLWWPGGDSNPEVTELDDLFTLLGLSQLVSEPTNFEPHKNPSCIDLIITDQPNLILDSGTRPSLDPYCHHHIINGKINFRVPPSPPFERKIWHFNRANSAAIKRSMVSFPWLQHLSLNTDPNWQVKSFTDIFLSIMEAFIPNDIKKITPPDPPWMTKHIKALLNKKNRLIKILKGMVTKLMTRMDLMLFALNVIKQWKLKLSYMTNLGNILDNPNTPQKSYWKLINRVMNISRAPKIPPYRK